MNDMRNILVFEKERIVCLDIKTMFSGNGFNVVFGHSVHELAGKGIEPVLVILDLLTYQLFEQENLWSYFGYPSAQQVPLILSFSGKEPEVNHGFRTEMNVIGKVTKPYNSTELVEIYRDYQDRLSIGQPRTLAKVV